MVQNFTDKAGRGKIEKNRITCRKGTMEATISAAANGEKQKKKAQVSIFIHIQIQVALECKIANFHFCRDELLCYWTAQVTS